MARDVVYVIARADNGVIARDGRVPWRIGEDLRRFVAHTMGTPMIMGRKTFESFPAPLKDRRHIVLTRDPDWSAPGAEVALTVEEALRLAGDGEVSVIGGAEIYALFMPYATRIELTEVHEDTEGDVAMPYPGPEWIETAREERPAGAKWPAHSFVTLERGASGAGERAG
jgi:dihydrofolate reductase